MTELPFILVGGLLGSAHCVGMCGPLALALGAPSHNFSHNVRRQLVFSVGRVSTYGFLGALAGFCSLWISRWTWLAINLQAVLAVVGGLTLLLLGLMATGILPQLRTGRFSSQSCSAARSLKTLLLSSTTLGAFLAGVFTGFIPCGLVYAFVAVAAASGDAMHGWLIMTTFGAGTIPLMLLTGCGATLLSVATRARVLKVAAWCIVAVGVISIARGAGALRASTPQAACPFCHPTSSTTFVQ